MEAAKQLSKSLPAAPKTRVSRFSNTVLTKKVYFPTHNPDINYAAIFASPWKVGVETDTHTTITIGGSPVIVTEMDEPQHVLISAGNEDTMKDAESRINEVFTQPDLARRLVQQFSRSTDAPTANPVVAAIGTIYDQNDIAESVTETIQVPFSVVGLIIGRKGDNLHHLQEMFSVQLRIQRDNEVTDGSVMRDVTIRGRQELVEKAKEAINTIVQTGRSDIISSLQSSRDGFEKMPVPNDRVGLVIGRHGAVIKDLMSRTCTQIQVPRDPDHDNPTVRSIVITGDPKNVLEAKKLIQDIVDGQMGTLPMGMPTIQMTVPDDKVGLVIGKGGVIIKDIQLRTKAFIQIPGKPVEGSNPPVRLINIAGTEEQMKAAKEEIQRMIGTTAGVGQEYKEQSQPMNNPWSGMQAMFNGAADLDQMQQYMQMQMQMSNPSFYHMQQSSESAESKSDASGYPVMPYPSFSQPPVQTAPSNHTEDVPPGDEAPPGVDEDEAPPGL
ncbi:hypothetical protein JH06_3357 [Blastocystis sp. subtype 4]|uniref:hypothetical protein n=1 Tax=Blastocystis sp. subtype 4 TaxID=944170 RepID=UPI000711CB7E|nr:hypothetical protein JH06_3357 [Blastocystis sp. subtype 4]KNB42875.1 hypothetical protein JH06_3357 [Blastocystis sp. subtype 4]|eukprot:XP_014526318.1 hypothetical protein JH06_3357 [Blastocystis sp. subtype 4]